MERLEVYRRITGERQYQDNMPESRSVRRADLSQLERIALMEVCLWRAKELWYSRPGEALSEVSDQFRKVAALCVQDGEQNGMPHR